MTDIFLITSQFLDLEILPFSCVAIPSFFTLGSGRHIFFIKINTWTWWMRIFSPLSSFLRYEGSISFATMTNMRLIFDLMHLVLHLLFSLDHLRHIVRIVESFLSCPESFFLLITIYDWLVIWRYASNWQFSEGILDASFVYFTGTDANSLVAKVEFRWVEIGRISELFFGHRNVIKRTEYHIRNKKHKIWSNIQNSLIWQFIYATVCSRLCLIWHCHLY